MNPVAEEMYAILNGDDDLAHYGMPRRSGRYPWGSGDDPYQHSRDFISRVEALKKEGWTETPENIKAVFGMTTTQYRAEYSLATNERKALQFAKAKSLKDDGKGWTEIGKELGVSESTVRGWFATDYEVKRKSAQATADILRARLEEFGDEKGMIDVGKGAPEQLGISKEKMNQALKILQDEGYPVYSGGIPNATNEGKQTTQKVLCPKGTEHREIYEYDRVHTITDTITRDGGETFEKKFTYPESMDSSRLKIRYNEEGGLERDGIVEIRRGVADLSLGESRYSQVRILVDDTHYIKGMAIYSDDMPDGVDVVFNTNKHKGTPQKDVLKEIKADPDNPFGSAIKDADQGGQYWYTDADGNRKLGLINKRADEGDWSEWKDALPSQFLAKQSREMAKKQLALAKADKEAEFEEICSITNPTIKKHMLEKFADNCDSAAVDLQAAALPGQKYHVIIPVNSLKDNECYAPNYENGTKLALIRYPHGGTFEIPIVTVNNDHPGANKIMQKNWSDAIGINKQVADRLSGADYDGDTVMAIPTHDRKGRVKIVSTNELEGLKGFDAKEKYGPASYEGKTVRLMSKKATGQQMGVISNLITDMTLAGASEDELAAAVRHSMVVIDAHKHKLDYKQSEIDNNIAALHKEYQGKSSGGASTILSRSKGIYYVDKRQGSYKVNEKGKDWYDPDRPEGAKLYKTSDDLYYVKKTYDKTTGLTTVRTSNGKKITYNAKDPADREAYAPVKKTRSDGTVYYTNKAGDIEYRVTKRIQRSTKMAERDDAYTLMSDAQHPMEIVYADYANSMKSLGNRARKEMVSTGKIPYSSSAKATYAKEVASLNTKLNDALKNAVYERAAQRKTAYEVKSKKEAGILTDKGDIKKAKNRAISKYRQEVGAVSRKKRNISITDREWEAIMAGAISESKLKKILDNADVDELRERATPRTRKTASQAQINRIKAYQASNYTIAQIAEKMNMSPSTVSKYLKGAN